MARKSISPQTYFQKVFEVVLLFLGRQSWSPGYDSADKWDAAEGQAAFLCSQSHDANRRFNQAQRSVKMIAPRNGLWRRTIGILAAAGGPHIANDLKAAAMC
ncbi:hypothetical protein CUJ87_25990 [Paraburkholderia caledonica]|nr:hypothetical protein CUJ87_25990 [Paraburkholderia caledonica]